MVVSMYTYYYQGRRELFISMKRLFKIIVCPHTNLFVASVDGYTF